MTDTMPKQYTYTRQISSSLGELVEVTYDEEMQPTERVIAQINIEEYD